MEKVPTSVLARDLFYEATFQVPSFALGTRAAELAEAAFEVFQPLGMKLDDLRFESASRQPADFLLVCGIPQRSTVIRYRLGSLAVSTEDPSIDAETGAVLLDSVYGVLHRLGVTVKRASQTFTFTYHFHIDAFDVASWFAEHSLPPVAGLRAVGLTFAADLPDKGFQFVEVQPSYVHPGPNRLFMRVTSRFNEEHLPADLVQVAAKGVTDLWAQMGFEVNWKE